MKKVKKTLYQSFLNKVFQLKKNDLLSRQGVRINTIKNKVEDLNGTIDLALYR
jgi:hypothetical protein